MKNKLFFTRALSIKLQFITQLIFLALFLVLILSGRVQLWAALLLLGVMASLVVSRIYCGWLCPINTVINKVTWLKSKLGIRNLKAQKLSKPWIRFLILALFVTTFVFSMVTGRAIPALPALLAAGIILTFFFSEELWHRYLCPFGTILTLPASVARFKLTINQEKCNSCGICKKVCPAKAVDVNEKVYTIKKNDCLVCLECLTNCKNEAVSYN